LGLQFGTTELSHDGEFVAYDSCIASDRAIYIASLETSERRRVIPVDQGRGCTDVRWSLDDRMLSYVSPADYGLNVVSVDGSKHVRLPTTGFVEWQSWSPSGEEIVYENGRGGSRSLRIISLQGDVRELTRFGDLKGCETWAPDWSPDGTRISFTACDRLYTISPQGTDMQQLASGAYSPRWSVDGQWIFFLSGSLLMRVRRDGQFLSRVAEIPPPYPGASNFSLGIAR
jgi:Tol biopolymer transport system component